MKQNIGSKERMLRFGVAALLLVLYFAGTLSGTVGTIALVVGIVMALTALIRFCPAYTLLGCKSCGAKSSNDAAD